MERNSKEEHLLLNLPDQKKKEAQEADQTSTATATMVAMRATVAMVAATTEVQDKEVKSQTVSSLEI